MKLASRPILTQSVTTAVLFATGDTMAQQLVEKKGLEKHDLARTGRMALYGGAVFGPAATTWFKFLQNKVVLKNKNAEIIARVACDQTIFASTNLFVFLSSMAIMEGSSPKDKLDGMAFHSVRQLQAGAAPPQSFGRQCHLIGLELLSQLPEQSIECEVGALC